MAAPYHMCEVKDAHCDKPTHDSHLTHSSSLLREVLELFLARVDFTARSLFWFSLSPSQHSSA